VLAAGGSCEEIAPAFVKQPRDAMTTVHLAEFAAQHPVLSLIPETSRAALLRASSTVTCAAAPATVVRGALTATPPALRVIVASCDESSTRFAPARLTSSTRTDSDVVPSARR
jgi:hypothetical protein